MSDKKPIGKSLVPTHVAALTLADYKKLEKEGKITRPLTDRGIVVRSGLKVAPD